jgi:hypothetical protein
MGFWGFEEIFRCPAGAKYNLVVVLSREIALKIEVLPPGLFVNEESITSRKGTIQD